MQLHLTTGYSVPPRKSPNGPIPEPLASRFWPNVIRGRDCWLWTGAVNSHGYGRLRSGEDRSVLRAHRVSWELHFGPIPDGLFVLHYCDNPPCVRPDHLFLGTNTDNLRDASKKGRTGPQLHPERYQGENGHRTKLTERDVRDIRRATASQQAIAAQYGINPSSVSKIVLRKTWKHI